jgi:hypothetical protein
MRKLWIGLAVGVAALVGLDLWAGRALSQQLEEVLVRNFPEIQEVSGKVAIEGISRRATLLRFEDIVVSPVRRSETLNLVPGGRLVTDGFTGVVLSLSGEVKDTLFSAGTVGAVLVPDEVPVQRAFTDGGAIQLPLEVAAPLTPGGSSFFASEPTVLPVAFPAYRIFFYNSGDKSVEVSLFAYLTT